MKVATTFVGCLITIALLLNCKKSTGPVIPGWEVLSIGSNVDLTDVDFVDENYGWVIGGAAVIYHTTDGGNTWVEQPYPQFQGSYPRLHDIDFIDRQNGWAVGKFGTIIKTTDGGQNWIKADSQYTETFNLVIFTDLRHGWIRGSSLVSYLRTTDGGESWIPVSSNPYEIGIWDFVDSLNGWARINSAINKTSDGGISWTNIYPGPIPGGSLDFVDLYNGWGLMGARVSEYETWYWVIHTADGGFTWETQMDTFKNVVLWSMEMLNFNTGWIAKEEANTLSVLHTINGGVTWRDQPLPQVGNQIIFDMVFVNEKVGWAVGSQGLFLRTKTGGNPIS